MTVIEFEETYEKCLAKISAIERGFVENESSDFNCEIRRKELLLASFSISLHMLEMDTRLFIPAINEPHNHFLTKRLTELLLWNERFKIISN